SDAAGGAGLDDFGADLGFPIEPGSDLAGVGTAILSGERVTFSASQEWPLPALPPNVVRTNRPEPGVPAVVVTDQKINTPERAVVYRPSSLRVGVGASKGAAADEIAHLIDDTLLELGVSPRSVRYLGTADVKADERGLLAAAAGRGWRVVTFPARRLAAVPVPNPSEVVRRAVGTPGVAEAAALIEPGSVALAAAAVLGAPLGHDHVMISLSDLHTAWPVIERRVAAAAEGDLVTCFYNPASRKRDWQLRRALELLAAHRPPSTPVGWVRDAS